MPSIFFPNALVDSTFANYGIDFAGKAYDKGTYGTGDAGLIALTCAQAPGLDSTSSSLDIYGFADLTFSNRGGNVVQVASFDVVGVDVAISDDNDYIAFLQVGVDDALVCVYVFAEDTETWNQLLDCVPFDVVE